MPNQAINFIITMTYKTLKKLTAEHAEWVENLQSVYLCVLASPVVTATLNRRR
jgi:hypothetical protein